MKKITAISCPSYVHSESDIPLQKTFQNNSLVKIQLQNQSLRLLSLLVSFSTENKCKVHVSMKSILLVVLPCQMYFSIICFSIISRVLNHGVFPCLSAPQSSGRISWLLFSSSNNLMILLQSLPEPLCLTLNNSSTVL